MWHSGSKCRQIEASMKASRKRLKADLMLKVRNFSPTSIASKLVEFSLFDNFFPDLAKFLDLDVFSLFDFPEFDNFPDFLACSTPFLLISNLLTSPSPSFLLEASLLLSFLPKANLLPLFLLRTGLLGDPVVFSMEVSGAAILLKPWINR